MLLPCGPVNHATMRNRTHCVADGLERAAAASPQSKPDIDPPAEMVVLTDGAHHLHFGLVAHLDAASAHRASVAGVYALEPRHRTGLELVERGIGRLRHLIRNADHKEAHDELFGLRHVASEAAHSNGEKFRPAVARLLWNC